MPKIDEPQVRIPTLGTLRTYGLTPADYLEMCRRQNFTCPVCRKPFADRMLVIDHEHVKGWRARKRKKMSGGKLRSRFDNTSRVMTPAERRPYVRGILHAWCNGFVRAWLTLDRAESILSYLKDYERRKSKTTRALR